MEYLSHLRDALVQPLKDFGADGVQNAIAFMDSYCLMKEDIENLMEISMWGGKPSPFSKLDPKVRFTSKFFPNLTSFVRKSYSDSYGMDMLLKGGEDANALISTLIQLNMEIHSSSAVMASC